MKLWIKTLLFLAMLIVQADDSIAESVSITATNSETTARKYVLTSDYPVYLRSGRSEYAQAYWIIPKDSALLILEEQDKWFRVRFFDEGKQFEGWILNSNVIIYVEEYNGKFERLITEGVIKLKKVSIDREERKLKQEINALELKNKEIPDSEYKSKLDVYEELSRIDVQNKFKIKTRLIYTETK